MNRRLSHRVAALLAFLTLPIGLPRLGSSVEASDAAAATVAASPASATSASPPGGAKPAEPGVAGKQPSAAETDLTVAVLDFQSATPGAPDAGRRVAEMLTALLSGQNGFSLVDRPSLDQILREKEIKLTGIVDPQKGSQIGRLVNADLLITGDVFPVEDGTVVLAKVIGTETSLVVGVMIKVKQGGDLSAVATDLSVKVAEKLRESGPRLVSRPAAGRDPMPDLKKRLAGQNLPIVSITIAEQSIGVGRTADPAAETELRALLVGAGFTVMDAAHSGRATVAVKGEAISEFAARIGNLFSCTARLELSLVDDTGKILFTDRVTTRAADLSDTIAAKTALQKAGHVLGLNILRHFAAPSNGPSPKSPATAPTTLHAPE